MWLDLSTKWRFIGDMWYVEILDIDPLYGDDDVRFGFLLEMRIGEARNGDGLYGDIFVGEWVMVVFSLVGLCWVVIRRPGL